MIAKVGLGLVGIGAIGIGGVAFTKPEWLGINKETKWAPLSKDNGYQDTTEGSYKDKFGSNHKNYLVGLDEVNKDWWNEKYESIKNAKPTEGKFKGVSDGYGGEANYLKKVCEDAYKTSEGDFHAGSGANNGDKFKKDEVWKYCSYIGEKPKTVGEISGEGDGYSTTDKTNPIGKDKKGELLSAKDGNNEKLWKLKNDEFFGRGVFSQAPEPADAFFKALFDTKSTNKDALKNKCLVAYKSTSIETPTKDQPKADDVVKYCSAKSIK